MAATKAPDEAAFIEAVRSMPALVLGKVNGHADNSKILLSAIAEVGQQHGLSPCQTERAKFHAAFWWFQEAITALAADRGQSLEEVVRTFASVAAEFAARNE